MIKVLREYRGSLTPTVGYLTLLDTHSLWCMLLVIAMVFWAGIVRVTSHSDLEIETVDSLAGYAFLGSWLLVQAVSRTGSNSALKALRVGVSL